MNFRPAVFALLFIIAPCIGTAQDLVQKVKGVVTDETDGSGLEGATVQFTGAGGTFSATTGVGGVYSVDVAVGRYKLAVSFTGFSGYIDEILVVAGKELVVNVALSRNITILETIEVQSTTSVPEIPGLRSLSVEKTLRIPANFFDPVRVVTAYPGVVAANDQGNAVIIRGNSPNALLWRLNDLDIVNPNHLSNAGMFSDRPAANGGGVNILSAQMLDRTDFYTGAFPARFGNATGGVIDMKLREGNRDNHEFTAQASLIGIDLAAEGPIAGSGKNSFIANYRYSTVGLLSALGINFGDESINFQDFAFATDFMQKNGGKLSVFGFWGYSRNEFVKKDSSEWQEDKDRYDILYDAGTFAIGTRYEVPVSNGRLSIASAYSRSAQERRSSISSQVAQLAQNVLYDDFAATNAIWSNSIRIETALSKKSTLETGAMVNVTANDLDLRTLRGCFICSSSELTMIAGESNGTLLQPFLNFTTALSPVLSLETGVRYLHYTYNGTSAIDPRVSLVLRPASSSGINLAYSHVSQLQLPLVYLSDGNKQLDFTSSHHVDLTYWQHLTESMKLTAGAFYQYLYNVPISADATSTFSVLNLIDGIPETNLVSEGTGLNYGVDATIEKYFFGSTYLMVGAAYYQSKYAGGDGVERDTRFNGDFTFNTVYGKEWQKPSRNRTIGLNTRLLYLGGMRASSVDVEASQSRGETVYDKTDPFARKMDDYFRLDFRLSFRKNKPGYTRTFAIDIQNLTGHLNPAYQYYDNVQQKVLTKNQLGIIPVLVYRIDF